MALTISRLTTEYLFWPVTTPNDLSTSTVEVAFMDSPTSLPGETDWEDAALLADNGDYRVRILVGPGHVDAVDLTPPAADPVDYQVWVRINDNPERPVRRPSEVTVE